MRQAVIDITSFEHLNEIISGEKEKKKVIIDFWANWCPPCKVIAPLFQKLAIQAPVSVGFYMVNIDEVVEVSREFEIRAIPTFMYFKGGNRVAMVTGADGPAVEALVFQAVQDDDPNIGGGGKVADVTGADGDAGDAFVSQGAQDDDLKREKQPSEYKM